MVDPFGFNVNNPSYRYTLMSTTHGNATAATQFKAGPGIFGGIWPNSNTSVYTLTVLDNVLAGGSTANATTSGTTSTTVNMMTVTVPVGASTPILTGGAIFNTGLTIQATAAGNSAGNVTVLFY
jgi:hypothetical protein